MLEPKPGEWWWVEWCPHFELNVIPAQWDGGWWRASDLSRVGEEDVTPICPVPTPSELEEARFALTTVRDEHEHAVGDISRWDGPSLVARAAYQKLWDVLRGHDA